MNLTKRLKDWLVQNMEVAKDASDEEFQKTFVTAIAEKKLSPTELHDLTKDPEADGAKSAIDSIKSLNEKFDTLIGLFKEEKENIW